MSTPDRVAAAFVALLFVLVVGGITWLTAPTAAAQAPTAASQHRP